MTVLRVAQAQVATGADLDANLRQVADQTAWAAAAGARLVTFPEADRAAVPGSSRTPIVRNGA